MSRKTQRYSKEFKAEAVRTVPENQLSISEGASRVSRPECNYQHGVTPARQSVYGTVSRARPKREYNMLQMRKMIQEG
ncbi:transposase, partial [Shigella sonnei]|uniref:transposase n=1 Tax=Shigella sonnei TaxID=624 RepID=UPI000A62588D